jgi:hypothetical protein
MKKMLITAGAIAAAVLFAPIAAADTDAYMQYLRSHNVTGGYWSDATLLSMGQQECEAMKGGKPDDFLIGELEKVGYGAAQADDIVYAARHFLTC